jgi:hypothetical protein
MIVSCGSAQRGEKRIDGEAWTVKQLVEFHQKHKAGMQVQDVYKLLYQGNLGVEHLLSDSLKAIYRVYDELASLSAPFEGEILLEPISTDGQLVRVNLRVFKSLNLDPVKLVEIMYKSARTFLPDTNGFHREWNEFSKLVSTGELQFVREHVTSWEEQIAKTRIKPVSHSMLYGKFNGPAYRVVKREIFESYFELSK